MSDQCDYSDTSPVLVFFSRDRRNASSSVCNTVAFWLLGLAQKIWACDSMSYTWDNPKNVKFSMESLPFPGFSGEITEQGYKDFLLESTTKTTIIIKT